MPAIAGIHRRACLVAYSFMGWSHSEEEVREWYGGKLDEWSWGRVADDGRVLGFVSTAAAHIDQLFVEPECSGRGIGTVLLMAALDQIGAGATLHVHEENHRARRFYERHGFKDESRFLDRDDRAFKLLCRRA